MFITVDCRNNDEMFCTTEKTKETEENEEMDVFDERNVDGDDELDGLPPLRPAQMAENDDEGTATAYCEENVTQTETNAWTDFKQNIVRMMDDLRCRSPKENERRLETFLKKHAVPKGSKQQTHQKFSTMELYRIEQQDLALFYALYLNLLTCSTASGEPPHLLECKDKNVVQYLFHIDLDIVLKTQDEGWSDENLVAFGTKVQGLLQNHHDVPLGSALQLDFLTKGSPVFNKDKNGFNAGIHVQSRHILVSKEELIFLRKKVVKIAKEAFSECGFAKDADFCKIVDNSIQSCNWFLYGSNKGPKKGDRNEMVYKVYKTLKYGAAALCVEERSLLDNVLDFAQFSGHMHGTRLNRVSDADLKSKRQRESGETKTCKKAKQDARVERDQAANIREDIDWKTLNVLFQKAETCQWVCKVEESSAKLIAEDKKCLACPSTEHDVVGHSCLFVDQNTVSVYCFNQSHKKEIAGFEKQQIQRAVLKPAKCYGMERFFRRVERVGGAENILSDPVNASLVASEASTVLLTAPIPNEHAVENTVDGEQSSQRTEWIRAVEELDNGSVRSVQFHETDQEKKAYHIVRDIIENIAEQNGLRKRNGMVYSPVNPCYFKTWRTYEEFLSFIGSGHSLAKEIFREGDIYMAREFDSLRFPVLNPADCDLVTWQDGVCVLSEKMRFVPWPAAEFKGRHAALHIDKPFSDCYKPCPLWEKLLGFHFNREETNFLEAFLGRLLFPVKFLDDWQLVPFLKGVAGAGKSQIVNVVQKLFNFKDIKAMDSNTQQTFGFETAYNKRLCVFEDCELHMSRFFNESNFKLMACGQVLNIPRKFKTPLDEPWKVPMLWAGNHMPLYMDSPEATDRRWMIFDFQKTVSEDEKKYGIDEEIIENELPAVLARCCMNYIALIERVKSEKKTIFYFTPERFKNAKKEARQESCPVLSFLRGSLDENVGKEQSYCVVRHESHKNVTTRFKDFVRCLQDCHEKRNDKSRLPSSKAIQGILERAGFSVKEVNLCKSCGKKAGISLSDGRAVRCCDRYDYEKNRVKQLCISDLKIEIERDVNFVFE